MKRALVTLLSSFALMSGCLQWEEAPEGATGFLVVDDATLEGTLGGVPIERIRDVHGYCTERGWYIEMTAVAGDREAMTVLEVSELDMRDREAAVRFVESGREELVVEDGIEAGRASLVGCLGEDLGAPELELSASDVMLDFHTASDGDIEVRFAATFQSGDEVDGQFSMEMPVTD